MESWVVVAETSEAAVNCSSGSIVAEGWELEVICGDSGGLEAVEGPGAVDWKILPIVDVGRTVDDPALMVACNDANCTAMLDCNLSGELEEGGAVICGEVAVADDTGVADSVVDGGIVVDENGVGLELALAVAVADDTGAADSVVDGGVVVDENLNDVELAAGSVADEDGLGLGGPAADVGGVSIVVVRADDNPALMLASNNSCGVAAIDCEVGGELRHESSTVTCEVPQQ
jgi:hypothetical protein